MPQTIVSEVKVKVYVYFVYISNTFVDCCTIGTRVGSVTRVLVIKIQRFYDFLKAYKELIRWYAQFSNLERATISHFRKCPYNPWYFIRLEIHLNELILSFHELSFVPTEQSYGRSKMLY